MENRTAGKFKNRPARYPFLCKETSNRDGWLASKIEAIYEVVVYTYEFQRPLH